VEELELVWLKPVPTLTFITMHGPMNVKFIKNSTKLTYLEITGY
jgi:hypothetical protein